MELTGALGNFVALVLRWAILLAGAAASVWTIVALVKLIFSGGKLRDAYQFSVGLVVICVAYAALQDLPGTMNLAADLGQEAWVAIRAELARARAGGQAGG